MSIEKLEMILALVRDMGDDAKVVVLWYFVVSALDPLAGLVAVLVIFGVGFRLTRWAINRHYTNQPNTVLLNRWGRQLGRDIFYESQRDDVIRTIDLLVKTQAERNKEVNSYE